MDRIRVSSHTVRELVEDVCRDLGHPEAAKHCVKVLRCKHWLQFANELHDVPDKYLIAWGLPLMLVTQIRCRMNDLYRKEKASEAYGVVNYVIRPFLAKSAPAQFLGWATNRMEKIRDPELWAVLKLQRHYRGRKARLQSDSFDGGSEARLAALSEARREQRAREVIGDEFVPRWRERQSKEEKNGKVTTESVFGLRSHGCTPSGEWLQNQLANDWQVHGGKIIKCEVSRCIAKAVKEMMPQCDDPSPFIHRLVTLNWLEDLVDLEVVSDEQWLHWDMPYALVQRLKTATANRSKKKAWLAGDLSKRVNV